MSGELTFRSPGVGTREIDLSGPEAISPLGTPAGIIGTSLQGPAFVPITVGTWQNFVVTFGNTDGEKLGPLAMYEWMQKAKAGTYVRVLGVGDAKKRLTNAGSDNDGNAIEAGGVKNAGFTVGQRLPKENGYLGDNPYASTSAEISGRTYMLAAFMSESNGSDYLSSAGIQNAAEVGTVAATTKLTSTVGAFAHSTSFTINVPVAAGGESGDVTILFGDGLGTGAANQIRIRRDAGGVAVAADNLAQALVFAINGTEPAGATPSGGGTYVATDVGFATSGRGASGIQGVTATLQGSAVIITADALGTAANSTVLTDVLGTPIATAGGADPLALAGGATGIPSVPILRGVLMVPSGVVASLKSAGYTSNTPVDAQKPTAATGGGFVGDVNISSTNDYGITLLLNGHINTEANPNSIQASLSPLSPTYIGNVLNTDPQKIQEAGHLLYNHYPIHPTVAVVTGAGVMKRGEEFIQSGSNLEPIALLLTSSLGRNVGSATKPNYEGFQDRFRTAFSPWVTSQKFGSDFKQLFKVHSLDDGVNGSKYRLQVENIKSSNIAGGYGQFDLKVMRVNPPNGIAPSEDGAVESYNGVNLDPSSDNYIAKRVGDYSKYYDFDKMAGNQRLVVDGTHPNVSNYIRIEMHPDVTNGNMEKEALPLGYRGPHHLVTSGSEIFLAESAAMSDKGGDTEYFRTTSVMREINEPPNPIRRNISIGTDPSREVNNRLPWGFQFENVDSALEPNRNASVVNNSSLAFLKHYPYHQTSNRKSWVGDNKGTLDATGTVLDSSRFNNNEFNMEYIQIHTKSISDTVDAQQWAFAAYRRNGKLSGSLRKQDGTYDEGRFLNASKDFNDPASTTYLKFTFPLQGGFDGVNVFDQEKAKISNLAASREMDDENQGQSSGGTVATYMKAVDVMAEKSDVDIQVLALPGIRETKITNHALQKTEERFDAIYIMDIEERDILNNLVTSSMDQNISVANTVDNFKSRTLDSSFGAAYFPDILITDPSTLTNVRAAPSTAVIGAFANNDSIAKPWNAPAGNTRGVMPRVVQSTVALSVENMNSLYDGDINPLVKFQNAEGVVINGQKTLLAVDSALDRINVRRLLIDIRRKVRRVADGFIFEPNKASTLASFSQAVTPILQSVQQQSGVEKFKVLIDTTTTTQADIENNTIRGKIFLQPVRTVEFISLDFVVTNNGTEI